MTTSSFREPAILGRTGRLVTDQSESEKIISSENSTEAGETGPDGWAQGGGGGEAGIGGRSLQGQPTRTRRTSGPPTRTCQ